ncbi:MAG: hypothetical protein ACYSRZ_06200, partial [Planctomycetota bacterium]
DCDMHHARLLFDKHNNFLISMHELLYLNDNLIRIDIPDEYCCNLLGGFIKDNSFYVVFENVDTVDIYSVKKSLELINHIKLALIRYDYNGVITLPGPDNSCYLFGHSNTFPSDPSELLRTFMSGGHGVYYYKPFLAEIRHNKTIRHIKFDYGGKTDESFVVKEAVAGKNSIHLLGFRNIDVPFIGNRMPTQLVRPSLSGYGLKRHNFERRDYYGERDISQSVILYYANYNLKKKMNTRRHTIYQNTPGYDKNKGTYFDYGVLSADTKDDDVFVVFTWVELKLRTTGVNVENVRSDIYYWQCNDKTSSNAEKIAEGFCPLVRVDLSGNVHVFWVDRSGNVIKKVNKDGKWGNKEIILSNVSASPAIIYTKSCMVRANRDMPEAILYTKFLSAEFDKDNNLNVVFPSSKGVVYKKLKLE